MSLKSGKLTVVEENGDEIEELQTTGKVFRIGSSLSCDLVLKHSEAKRVHCEIESDSFGRISITNHSKRNPVRINGVPLKGTRPLYTGSVITILDKQIKWVNNQRLPRNKMEVDGLQTPVKELRTAEQAPNSEPSLHLHRKDALKRNTIHNFGRKMEIADDEDDQVTEPPLTREEDDDRRNQDRLTRASIVSAAKSYGATPPRSVRRVSMMPRHEKLIELATPLKSDKENTTVDKSANKNRLLLKCQPSGMVLTSYSPSTVTSVRKNTPKSFACLVESNPNTPKSDYGTPRSILSELNRDLDDGLAALDVTPKKTPLSSLRSMHLIDFTTPDVYKTPMQRAVTTTPLLKSALKNSTVKTGNKIIGSNQKSTLRSPASPKPFSGATTPKTIENKTRSASISKTIASSSITRSMPRKSISRLSFSAAETPTPLTRQRTVTVGSAKSAPRLSKGTTPNLKRKSLFVSKPLETPKSIFSATKSGSGKTTPGVSGARRHSCLTTPISTQKKVLASKTPLMEKKIDSGLERSETFILDSPGRNKQPQPAKTPLMERSDTFILDSSSVLGVSKSTSDQSSSDVVASSVISDSSNTVNASIEVKTDEANDKSLSAFLLTESSAENEQLVAETTNSEVELSQDALSNSSGVLNNTFDKETCSEGEDKNNVAEIPCESSVGKQSNEDLEAKSDKKITSRRSIANNNLSVTPARSTGRKSTRLSTLPSNVDNSAPDTPTDVTSMRSSANTETADINYPPTEIQSDSAVEVLNATFDKDDVVVEEEIIEEVSDTDNHQSASKRQSKRYSKLRQSPSGDDTLDLNTSLNALSKSEILSISILSHDEGNVSVMGSDVTEEASTPKPDLVQCDGNETPKNKSRRSFRHATSSKSINSSVGSDQSPDISVHSVNILNQSDILSVTVSSSGDANVSLQNQSKSTRRSRSFVAEAEDSSTVDSPKKVPNDVNIVQTVEVNRVETYTHNSPRLGGVRELLKTPKPSKEINLIGVKELVNTPKSVAGLNDLLGVKELVCTPKTPGAGLSDPKGVRELFNTPVRDDLSDLHGVKELLNTPKETRGLDDIKGMKEMFNTPARDDLSDVRGVKELVNTPKPTVGLSDTKGVKELFNTPKPQSGLDDLKGVKEMLNTPNPSVGLNDPKGMKELFNTPARNELNDIRGVKEMLQTPCASSPDFKGVRELMKTPYVPNYEDADALNDVFKTPAGRSRMVLSTPKSIAVERSDYSGNLMKTPKELNVLEDIEEVAEIFESPLSNFRSSKSCMDETDNILALSPEESFDQLTGAKPSNRRTYSRLSVTPKVLPIPIAKKTSTQKPPTDIEEWLEGVENVELMNEDNPAMVSSPCPKKLNKPLAASSCIKSTTRRSTRTTKSVNINDISGLEELDDSISEISGVFLDSEEHNNASETASKDAAQLAQTGSKSVQFVETGVQRRSSLKGRQQLSKLSGRISTPYVKKLANKSLRNTLNSSSIQFIDESSVTDADKPLNSSRFKIRKSAVGDDISLELIDSNNDSSLLLEHTENNSQISREPESDSVISIAGEDDALSNVEVSASVDHSKLRKSIRGNEQTIEFVDANEVSLQSVATAKMSNTDAFKSILSATSKTVECNDDEEDKTIDISSRATSVYSVSLQEELETFNDEEEKLLEQYDKELENSTEHQASIEVVYVSTHEDNDQSKACMTPAKDALNDSETTITESNESRYKSLRQSTANVSSLEKSTYKSPGKDGPMDDEFSNFAENPTLRVNQSKTPNVTRNIGKRGNLRKTLGASANVTLPTFDVEAEKLKIEFSNFETNPKSRIARGASQLPVELTRMTVSRRTVGRLPLNPSFDLEAERERRNMSIDFENFNENDIVTTARGRSLSPLKKPNLKASTSNRKTMGQPGNNDDSFDYEYELERRNRSLELAHLETEPSVRRSRRGRSEVGLTDKKSSESIQRRLTSGQSSCNTFDHEAELERRDMSLQFENFKTDQTIDPQSKRRTVHMKATEKNLTKDRRTMGQQPLTGEFNVEEEKERYIVQKEFEHFEEVSRPMRKRGRSQYPINEDKPSTSFEAKKNRRTMGQNPLTEEFDVEAEKERHILEKEFENFESEGRKLRVRMRSQSPVNEKEKSLEAKKNRRTMGQKPLTEVFDVEAEKERLMLEKEFENFELQGRNRRERMRSQSPINEKDTKKLRKDRRTMGQNPLSAEFNAEVEKERYIMEKEFENFEPESRQMRTRIRSQSPIQLENTATLMKDRRTMGRKPSNDDFDVEMEKKRYHLEKEFANFNAEPQLQHNMREQRRSQNVHLEKTIDHTNKMKRKTMGDNTDLTFNASEEKERIAQLAEKTPDISSQKESQTIDKSPEKQEKSPEKQGKSPEKQEKTKIGKKQSARVRNFVVDVVDISTPSPQRAHARRRGAVNVIPVETVVINSDDETATENKQKQSEHNAEQEHNQSEHDNVEEDQITAESQVETENQTAKADPASEPVTEILPSRRRGKRNVVLPSENDEPESSVERTTNMQSRRRGNRNRQDTNADEQITETETEPDQKPVDVKTAGRTPRKGRAGTRRQVKTDENVHSIADEADSNEANANEAQSTNSHLVDTISDMAIDSSKSQVESETDENDRHVHFGENKYFDISRIDVTTPKGKRQTKKKPTKATPKSKSVADDTTQSIESVEVSVEPIKTTANEPVAPAKSSRSGRGAKTVETPESSGMENEPGKEVEVNSRSRGRKAKEEPLQTDFEDEKNNDKKPIKGSRSRSKRNVLEEPIKVESEIEHTNSEEISPTESKEPEIMKDDDKKTSVVSRSTRGGKNSVSDEQPVEESKTAPRSRRGAARSASTTKSSSTNEEEDDAPTKPAVVEATENIAQDDKNEKPAANKKPAAGGRSRRGAAKSVTDDESVAVSELKNDEVNTVPVANEAAENIEKTDKSDHSNAKKKPAAAGRSRRAAVKSVTEDEPAAKEQTSDDTSSLPSETDKNDQPIANKKPTISSRSRRGAAKLVTDDDSTEDNKANTKSRRGATRSTEDSQVVSPGSEADEVFVHPLQDAKTESDVEDKKTVKSRSRRGAKKVIDDESSEDKKPTGRSRRGVIQSTDSVIETESEHKQTNEQSDTGAIALSTEEEETANVEKKKATSRSRRAAAKPVAIEDSTEEKNPTGRSRRGRAQLVEPNVETTPLKTSTRGRKRVNIAEVETNTMDEKSNVENEKENSPGKKIPAGRARAHLVEANVESSTPSKAPTRGRKRGNAADVEAETVDEKSNDENEKENSPEKKTPAKRTRRLESVTAVESSATKTKSRSRRKNVEEDNANDSNLNSKLNKRKGSAVEVAEEEVKRTRSRRQVV